MKQINQYLFYVDTFRNNGYVFCEVPLYQRQTKGMYQVAAKSLTQAQKLLQQKIGFGSICPVNMQYAEPGFAILDYKTVKRVTYNNVKNTYEYQEAHHACEQQKSLL